MSSFAHWTAIASVVGLFVGVATPQAKPYPKPLVASAAGQIAFDFALRDQDGKDFRLANQRGHWVLLFFYRGYW
jgi:cytochrome oxidase Cu insertion factor (SCO1/SenC/PrrC family)